jgi:hypothetical protein
MKLPPTSLALVGPQGAGGIPGTAGKKIMQKVSELVPSIVHLRVFYHLLKGTT